jgi:hypothetical protein
MVFAGKKRRHNVPIGKVTWEIIGPKDGHDTVRPVPQHRLGVGAVNMLFPCALGLGRDRQLDIADHRCDFLARFPPWLARLAGNQGRELLGPRLQDGCVDAADADAPDERRFAPRAGGIPRPLDGLPNLGGRSNRPRPDDFTSRRAARF